MTRISMIHGVGAAALAAALSVATPTLAQVGALPDAAGPPSGASPATDEAEGSEAPRIERARPRVSVVPYLGVDNVVSARLAGIDTGEDVTGYTSLSAGVDASIATHRAEGSIGVRYERRFGWVGDSIDGDSISGIARGRYTLLRGLNLEGGALASRATSDGVGAFAGGAARAGGGRGDVLSLYAGPTFARRLGDLDVGAGYRFGYTRLSLDAPEVDLPGVALGRANAFSSSTNHALWGSVGQRPGNWLPVGWQVSGGWDREDARPFDQRYEGRYARVDATMPVSRTLALVAGVGYENIEISQRPVLRDADGVPVVDGQGRYVSDRGRPRQLAFETDGLIWDAGILWRPSRRTQASARVGRRYGDLYYSGSLSYQPTSVTSLSLGVYTGLSSFGRGLSGGLAGLPTQFDVTRNPIDGQIDPCVFGRESAACLNTVVGAARAAQYRSRGVQLSASTQLERWSLGLGGGYERRTLLAPDLVALLGADIIGEDSWYLFASAGRALDARSSLSLSAYVNGFDSDLPNSGGTSYGATASYARQVIRRLGATAAVSVSAFDRDGTNTELIGSALLGLRYSFD